MRHPALTAPEVARGTLRALPDGRLVKDQTSPRREISEIGDGIISIRRSPEGEANLLPVPSEMLPMLRILGLAAGGRLEEAADASELGFEMTPEGWRVALSPGDGPVVHLAGCGRRLSRIEIREPDGVERVYFLGAE